MQRSEGASQNHVLSLAALALASSALGACRNSSDGTPAGTGSTAAVAAAVKTASPCSLVSPNEAVGVLGGPALTGPETTSVPPVTVCKYSNGKYSGALTLRFETGRTLSDFGIIRKGHDENGQKTSDLSGLGDSAFKFSLPPINGVSMLGKGTVVLVQGEYPQEKLAQLGRLILERL
ncbi:MAG TPA: hypothetical protein VHC69_06100 [Polyangiaceae bacterium]|nr:hypothetical protein [Polyangiaceae bacterium]